MRDTSGGAFQDQDLCLGSNGFKFRVASDPITFPNGLFYIEFGADASEFGNFTPGQYYLAPENIKVKKKFSRKK